MGSFGVKKYNFRKHLLARIQGPSRGLLWPAVHLSAKTPFVLSVLRALSVLPRINPRRISLMFTVPILWKRRPRPNHKDIEGLSQKAQSTLRGQPLL